MLLIGRGRPREHPREPRRSLRVTFYNVTSGEKAPIRRILRNFRLGMPTPKGTPRASLDLRSLPVAMVLVLLYYTLYYYYSKKKGGKKPGVRKTYLRSLLVSSPSGHVTFGHVTSGHVISGHVTSGHVISGHVISGHVTDVTSGYVTSGSTSQHFHKCYLSCPHILLGWLINFYNESCYLESSVHEERI